MHVMGGCEEEVEVDESECCNGNGKMKEDGLKTNAVLNGETNVAQMQGRPRRGHDYVHGAYDLVHYCSCPWSRMAQQSDFVLGHWLKRVWGSTIQEGASSCVH